MANIQLGQDVAKKEKEKIQLVILWPYYNPCSKL